MVLALIDSIAQHLRCLLLALVLVRPYTFVAVANVARDFGEVRDENGPDYLQTIPSNVYGTRFANVSWNNKDWLLTTTHLDQGHYQSRMSIANGYIGINVAALGPFFEVDIPVNGDVLNGWPLFERRQTFATVAGFWDSQPTTNGTNFPWLEQYGGDSVISGLPHWSGILITIGDNTLNASTDATELTNFSSTLDMKRGVMNWAFTWKPGGSTELLDIEYQMFTHKLHVNQAFVQLNITASTDLNATITSALNGDCAVRTTFADKGQDNGWVYSAVKPLGVENVTAYVYAGLDGPSGFSKSSLTLLTPSDPIGQNESSIGQSYLLQLTAGQQTTITKFVGVASSDGFDDPQTAARAAATTALTNGYSNSLESHAAEWNTIFGPDSVDEFSFTNNGSLPDDPYIVEQAITAVANPYYLLQNTVGQNALVAVDNASIHSNSIMVAGLASDSYAGQIFWDAEVWMQPGLVAAFPQAAVGISNYRAARLGQAQENVKTFYQSSKNQSAFSIGSAVFPWTSGRFGNCTVTGPCFDYEYHINGDIAMELANYWVVSGDTAAFRDSYFPVYDAMATFYSDLLVQNGSEWSLTNMTDPDEYANFVDNGGYTMPLIAKTLSNANTFRAMFGIESNTTWTNQSQTVAISRDETVGITLEYVGMNGSIAVKQADVVLDTYPLRYEDDYTQQDSLRDLDYYAAKQSSDGPGMTYAIFSIVASQVSPSGCSAYTYHQYSSQPYSRAPWFQFSEQLNDDYNTNGGTHPAYPFLTGHGGANQVVLFGYLGLRLVPDFNLYIDPTLPPQIPQLRYRTFYWQGWPISAFSNQTHTILTRLSTPYATANPSYETQSIPVVVGSSPGNRTAYSLAPNSTITLPNRQSGSIATVPGNIFQCSGVTSLSAYEPGQFPISAIDGAISTTWQPSSANETAGITVTVPHPGDRIKAVYFDWGRMPPATFSIILHNNTLSNPYLYDANMAVEIAMDYPISINAPYDTGSAADITAPSSNTSLYMVEDGVELYASEFASLWIRGNQAYGSNETVIYNASAPGGTVAEWVLVGEDGVDLEDLEVKRKREISVGSGQASWLSEVREGGVMSSFSGWKGSEKRGRRSETVRGNGYLRFDRHRR